MAWRTKPRAVRHRTPHSPFSPIPMREKHVDGRGLRRKLTDFFDAPSRSWSPGTQFVRTVPGESVTGECPLRSRLSKDRKGHLRARPSSLPRKLPSPLSCGISPFTQSWLAVYPQCIVILPRMRDSARHHSAGSGERASNRVSWNGAEIGRRRIP